MTSTPGSTPPRAEPVRRAAVVTHGRPETIGAALERVQRVAARPRRRAALRRGRGAQARRPSGEDEDGRPELAVVLGGDGTMLRALERFLGTGVPVLGVNFGRVGFLTSLTPDGLDEGLARVFQGEYTVSELPTLDAQTDGGRWTAVNDVVCTSSSLGRMVLLGWAVGDEHLGEQACDGVICSTPSGSTAYNLSNGGPVLVWGLDALAVTFVAPALAARAPARRPARPGRHDPQRDARRRLHAARRRPPRTRGRARRRGRDPPRRPEDPARVVTGGDVLPALSRHIRLLGGRDTLSSALLRRLRIENLVLIREAELELAPGLNAITGETGAGKTILAQAVGLLLGARGDSAAVAPGAAEAYVEAELDLPDGLLDEDGLESLAELRPQGEEGLVIARRVFGDGRTRAYAWGRAAPREDLAAVGERLIAMSGPVRAAPARPALVPARRARQLLRRRAAETPRGRPPGLARAAGGPPPPRRDRARRRRCPRAARGAARARRGHRRAHARDRARPAQRAGAPAPRHRARRPARRPRSRR